MRNGWISPLLYDGASLLDPSDHRLYYQGATGVSGTPAQWEDFGAALPGSADYVD